eukprot:TRINITY_DN2634_c0_g1_i1.p2 TRINITY_DN2634_c0_g1~~TRINITY_DN2634_c0_g1_i1.p2  ORF type:complete len:267 (-),score=52.64 TRINITY_DN2634_c0_g1_i1:46-846(-)
MKTSNFSPLKATALMLAYVATLFYILAMCTPWFYQRYTVAGDEQAFFGANPGYNKDSDFFDRTNCFIDGTCRFNGQSYKNNGNAQWVFTTVLVLMIVGWVPWLIYIHLLHFRSNPVYARVPLEKLLIVVTGILTLAFLTAAIIVFAAGITRSNTLYRANGLYGNIEVNPPGFVGALNYRYGAHAAWYFAIITWLLVLLSLLTALGMRGKKTTTVQTKTTTTTTATAVPANRADAVRAEAIGVPLGSPGLTRRTPRGTRKGEEFQQM